jgi:hypothetical protein
LSIAKKLRPARLAVNKFHRRKNEFADYVNIVKTYGFHKTKKRAYYQYKTNLQRDKSGKNAIYGIEIRKEIVKSQ